MSFSGSNYIQNKSTTDTDSNSDSDSDDSNDSNDSDDSNSSDGTDIKDALEEVLPIDIVCQTEMTNGFAYINMVHVLE